jgi:hypothetical protein
MKLPKKIKLCGQEYKMIYTSEHNGAEFDEEKMTITIGMLYPQDVPELFIHEVIEATMALRNMRYALEKDKPLNEDYMFCFNHKEFEQLCKDLAVSFKGLSFNDR